VVGTHAVANGLDGDMVLAIAAAAEERLTHPVARAIVHASRMRGLGVPEREDSEYTIGLGVEASVAGTVVHVGSERLMALRGVDVAPAHEWLERIAERAASPVFVGCEGKLLGVLAYADPLRPEAPTVVQALRARGVAKLAMVTGDQPEVARRVAEQVGIDDYLAGALPEQKVECVRALQREGRVVAVVGDGINDSPALTQADVGISVRGGSDVARVAAHVALLEGNLWKLVQAIDLARESIDLIRQNWDLLFYPNSGAIALSLLGVIGPVGATLISNGSAVAASLNALRPLLDGRL
jgi:P-type Cu2+ transporter